MSDAYVMKKMLRLVIEIPEFNAEDFDEAARIYAGDDQTPETSDRLGVIDEWMRRDVGLTFVTVPGDKCMNDDSMVVAMNGQIVDADVRNR